MKKVAIVIPAYNEEQTIADVINGVLNLSVEGFSFHPVVVNDCSRDETLKIAKQHPCTIIDMPNRLGIGVAVQMGFIYAIQKNYDYAIQVDGDGQHPPAEIPGLIEQSLASDADIVIGSRFLDKAGYQSTYFRRMGIQYFKWLLRCICRINITDGTSGFRMLNRKAIELANFYYPDEYPEPESLVLFSIHKLKISEAPVQMLARLGGKSSINFIAGIYYMIKVTMAIIYTYIRVKQSLKKWKTLSR